MSKTTQTATTSPHVIDVRTLPNDTIFVGFVGASAVTLSRIEELFSWDFMPSILAQFSEAAMRAVLYASMRNELDTRDVEIFTLVNQWFSAVVTDEMKMTQSTKGGAQ